MYFNFVSSYPGVSGVNGVSNDDDVADLSRFLFNDLPDVPMYGDSLEDFSVNNMNNQDAVLMYSDSIEDFSVNNTNNLDAVPMNGDSVDEFSMNFTYPNYQSTECTYVYEQ